MKKWLCMLLTLVVLDPSFDGAAEPDFPGANVSEWLSDLSAYGTEAAENSVPVVRANKSGSRLGRMSSNGSVLKKRRQRHRPRDE